MFKKFLVSAILTLTALSVNAKEATCKTFNIMKDSQKQMIVDAFEYGKPYGYEHTLPAIAWKESSLGRYTVGDPHVGGSYGPFQNQLRNVIYREYGTRLFKEDIKGKEKLATKDQIFVVSYKLMNDFEFAAKHAVLELKHWDSRPYVKTRWALWASYNGGYYGSQFYKEDKIVKTPNGDVLKKAGEPMVVDAQKYAKAINHYINLLTTCQSSPIFGK